jgi:hypothetical protein
MAVENFGRDLSFPAGADLSGSQYKFVELGTNGKVTVCNAQTDRIIGVLQNKPTADQMATVRVSGVTKVQADEALTIADEITTSADGQAITDATAGAGGRLVGIVLKGASTAGNLATALIDCAPGARLTA